MVAVFPVTDVVPATIRTGQSRAGRVAVRLPVVGQAPPDEVARVPRRRGGHRAAVVGEGVPHGGSEQRHGARRQPRQRLEQLKY